MYSHQLWYAVKEVLRISLILKLHLFVFHVICPWGVAIMEETFYWHDYETTGVNPAIDRPCQFAGLRTDWELNVIGEPLVIYCKPQDDILPSPIACMLTGITPQQASIKGCHEPQFIAKIYSELAMARTCGVGYNSIKFDDEVTRHLLYRNFFDPYQREWQCGNSRWDIINLMRFMRAIRPDGVDWPDYVSGLPSFRLQDLTAMNGIEHDQAHDALADVKATIDLARLVKKKQPQLFAYALRCRKKLFVSRFLNVKSGGIFLHSSSRLSPKNHYTALMMPLMVHPINQNAIICADLSRDPSIFKHTSEELHHEIFMGNEALKENNDVPSLLTVHLNRCPIVATPKLVDSKIAQKLNINLDKCRANWHALKTMGLKDQLHRLYLGKEYPRKNFVEQQLYDGFAPNSDKLNFEAIRSDAENFIAPANVNFSDPRYKQLMINYRARFFPTSLSSDERSIWLDDCSFRLTSKDSNYLTIQQFNSEIIELSNAKNCSEQQARLLCDLTDWGKKVATKYNLPT